MFTSGVEQGCPSRFVVLRPTFERSARLIGQASVRKANRILAVNLSGDAPESKPRSGSVGYNDKGQSLQLQTPASSEFNLSRVG